LKSIHDDLFKAIRANAEDYFKFYEQKREACAHNPLCAVIPTIALYTGINVQDYAHLCEKLGRALQETFGDYMFHVNEKNSANIRTLVSAIYSQWESMGDQVGFMCFLHLPARLLISVNLLAKEQKLRLPKRSAFTFRKFFEQIRLENNVTNIFKLFFWLQGGFLSKIYF
jgi:hypothetical protein